MTKIKIFPSSFKGSVEVPPSKSMAHRAIIAASLAKGKSTLHPIAFSDDIVATMEAMKKAGIQMDIQGETLIITSKGQFIAPKELIDCKESGSTLRFLIPLFGGLSSPVTFTGKPRLLARPLTQYQEIFHSQGLKFVLSSSELTLQGPLTPGHYVVQGNVSSQFITGLLFALPLLEGDSTLEVLPPFESQSYVAMTLSLLHQFGITIHSQGTKYQIPGRQTYQPQNFFIEGDFSQASFFLVAGILNGSLEVKGLSSKSLQGDKKMIDILHHMKGNIKEIPNGYQVISSPLQGTEIDVRDIPDLGPILALLLALSEGTSKLLHTERLRLKESDRVESTLQTLKALGATLHVEGDTLVIKGSSSLKGGVTINSFNDHRIVMMAAIAASRCEQPVIIEGAEAVQKSFPNFFEVYRQMGGKFEVLAE